MTIPTSPVVDDLSVQCITVPLNQWSGLPCIDICESLSAASAASVSTLPILDLTWPVEPRENAKDPRKIGSALLASTLGSGNVQSASWA